MRSQRVTGLAGQIVVGADADAERARLELIPQAPTGAGALAALELTAGQTLMAIQALTSAYAELCGARPESLVNGVNRTLSNRTTAAREGRRRGANGAAGSPAERTSPHTGPSNREAAMP